MAQERTFELLQKHWGSAIRTARGERPQTWLGEQINVDQTTISRLERGVYRLTPELMLALAAVLDRELSDLFSFPPGLVSREQYEQENRRLRAAAQSSTADPAQVAS